MKRDKHAVFFDSDYNGFKVFFWMGKNDAKWRNSLGKPSIKFVCEGKRVGKKIVGANGTDYALFSDYSLKPIIK